MNVNKFDQQIEASLQRLETIEQCANDSSSSAQDLLKEAIAESSIALEELHVAVEELQQQNRELLATRQQLEQERQRYQELFEEAPDGYLVTNEHGIIQEANRAAATLLNVAQRFLVGKPLSIFIAQGAQNRFHLEALLKIPQLQDWEINLQPRDGEPFPAAISVSASSRHSRLQGWRWLIRDLRERKQTEAVHRKLELEQEVNAVKTNLLRSISHEFRTPLNIIQMSIAVMERSYGQMNPQQQQHISQRMQASVEAMTRLLEEVQFFHQADDEQQSHLAIVELEPFCHSIVQEQQNLFDSQHQIIWISESYCPPVTLNTHLLRQILRNLLSNALKYSPQDQPVQFKLRQEPGTVSFHIQDWGIGIPDSERSHLFEPFYRGSNVRNTPGTGIGLAIVKKAVELMGGHVTFTSEVGEGSTFIVTIPLQRIGSFYS